MEYAKKERIGNPDLFTGRKEELAFLLNWIHEIKEEKSQSTAILARRKMGKTALMERLFNITFQQNMGVIPFYYEIKESKMWVIDFCKDFFLTFIFQYMAFKTRKVAYLEPIELYNLEKVKRLAEQEGFADLAELISSVKDAIDHEAIDTLWLMVRNAPRTIAARQGEFIVQMIDEFQFINAKIYRDKNTSQELLIKDMAAGYLSTAESKIAPLLISGSWVGWLIDELALMLPSRFVYTVFGNMPADEALEMVYKYSGFFNVPVTEETAYMIAQMTEGSPFYISSIIRSNYRHKHLTTVHGLTETLEYETLDDHARIKATWMEYVLFAFNKVNEINAKNVVLYLCQHRDKEVTRQELLDNLALNMTDKELELKLKALVRADIIQKGRTNFDYRGVQDNIFDKVFRGVYEKEINLFDVSTISKEYHEDFLKLKQKYHQLLGKVNYQKGYFAEFLILNVLKSKASKVNDHLKSITLNLPLDFNFCDYGRVWSYDGSTEFGYKFNVDIYARAKTPTDYSIIGEVKNRESKKFSKEEAVSFMEKFTTLKKHENLERVLPFVFSRAGFMPEAEVYCQEMGIAYSEDERWLDY